jgi:membrane protein YqaA with SNARE-associated domain
MDKERINFLLRNLLKGLLWFAVLLVVYIFLKDRVEIHPESLIGRVSDNSVAVYLIFLGSEVIFGIIPPEFFMAWAAEPGDLEYYVLAVTFLAFISYGAGVLGYWIGRFLNKAVLIRYARRRFFTQYESLLRRFGGFLLFVAAITPLPFSAVCMLLGSVKYNFKNFLLIALTRFLRFAFYSYLLWQAGSITL